MIIVAEELKEKKYFDSFEEVVKYYNLEEELPQDLEDLEDLLKELNTGEEHTKFKLLNAYEVECWWKGKSFNSGYYDTIEEAKEVFEKILEEMEEIKEDFKETTDKEKFIKELEENDEPIDFIQINKFDEFENVEVLIGKEFNWDRF